MEDVEAHMKRSILRRNAAKGVYKMRMSHISRLARFPLCFTAQFGRGRGRGLSVHSGVPILVCPYRCAHSGRYIINGFGLGREC